MAFLKYLVPYTVCALALVLIQNSFVLSADDDLQCVQCSTNGTDAASKCDRDAVNTTIVTNTCSADTCGAYTFNDSQNNSVTVRGCNVICNDELKSSLNVSSGWNCVTCNNSKLEDGTIQTNLCNQAEIQSSNDTDNNNGTSGSHHSYVAVVPMVLSAVLAISLTV